MPQQFKYSHSSQYPLDQNVLKLGSNGNPQSDLELQRFRLSYAKQLYWQQISARLVIDSSKINIFIPNLINLLTAEAINVSLKCVGAYDKEYTRLTQHMSRFWKMYTYRKLVPRISIQDSLYKPQFYITGDIGSLGLLGLRHEYSCADIPIGLRILLEYFWTDYSLSLSLSPHERMTQLLSKIGYDRLYLDLCSTALNTLLNERDPVFTQHLLGSKSITAIPQQVILGEVGDTILNRMTSLQLESNTKSEVREKYSLPLVPFDKVVSMVKYTLTIGNGAGFLQVAQAFILEGLLNVIDALSTSEYVTSTVSDYLAQGKEKEKREEEKKYWIAQNMALIADAYSMQAAFDSIEGADTQAVKYKNLSLQWLMASGQSSLPITDEQRLGAFL